MVTTHSHYDHAFGVDTAQMLKNEMPGGRTGFCPTDLLLSKSRNLRWPLL